MNKYLIITGSQPGLAQAEWQAIAPKTVISRQTDDYFVIESKTHLDAPVLMRYLGGTIKIVRLVEAPLTADNVIAALLVKQPTGRIVFGLSWHIKRQDRLGMEIKKQLVTGGHSARLVTSKQDILSPVIVTKEKVLDCVITRDGWGLTEAVHDFAGYSHRDFSRPASDAYAGMVPVKLARMMINLARPTATSVILDPFCGSGTILAEALVMGYGHLRGSDLSAKAVADTENNLAWINEKYNRDLSNVIISEGDVRTLTKRFERADIIVTEPHLGPPMRGHESPSFIKKVSAELTTLYRQAFTQFALLLPSGGRVVMIMPEWHVGGVQQLSGLISHPQLVRIDDGKLKYHHEKQLIWRQITIWEKK